MIPSVKYFFLPILVLVIESGVIGPIKTLPAHHVLGTNINRNHYSKNDNDKFLKHMLKAHTTDPVFSTISADNIFQYNQHLETHFIIPFYKYLHNSNLDRNRVLIFLSKLTAHQNQALLLGTGGLAPICQTHLFNTVYPHITPIFRTMLSQLGTELPIFRICPPDSSQPFSPLIDILRLHFHSNYIEYMKHHLNGSAAERDQVLEILNTPGHNLIYALNNDKRSFLDRVFPNYFTFQKALVTYNTSIKYDLLPTYWFTQFRSDLSGLRRALRLDRALADEPITYNVACEADDGHDGLTLAHLFVLSPDDRYLLTLLEKKECHRAFNTSDKNGNNSLMYLFLHSTHFSSYDSVLRAYNDSNIVRILRYTRLVLNRASISVTAKNKMGKDLLQLAFDTRILPLIELVWSHQAIVRSRKGRGNFVEAYVHYLLQTDNKTALEYLLSALSNAEWLSLRQLMLKRNKAMDYTTYATVEELAREVVFANVKRVHEKDEGNNESFWVKSLSVLFQEKASLNGNSAVINVCEDIFLAIDKMDYNSLFWLLRMKNLPESSESFPSLKYQCVYSARRNQGHLSYAIAEKWYTAVWILVYNGYQVNQLFNGEILFHHVLRVQSFLMIKIICEFYTVLFNLKAAMKPLTQDSHSIVKLPADFNRYETPLSSISGNFSLYSYVQENYTKSALPYLEAYIKRQQSNKSPTLFFAEVARRIINATMRPHPFDWHRNVKREELRKSNIFTRFLSKLSLLEEEVQLRYNTCDRQTKEGNVDIFFDKDKLDDSFYFQLYSHRHCDTNVVNEEGETPFTIAIQNINTNTIRNLLRLGANVNSYNRRYLRGGVWPIIALAHSISPYPNIFLDVLKYNPILEVRGRYHSDLLTMVMSDMRVLDEVRSPIVKILVEQPSTPTIPTMNANGETFLQFVYRLNASDNLKKIKDLDLNAISTKTLFGFYGVDSYLANEKENNNLYHSLTSPLIDKGVDLSFPFQHSKTLTNYFLGIYDRQETATALCERYISTQESYFSRISGTTEKDGPLPLWEEATHLKLTKWRTPLYREALKKLMYPSAPTICLSKLVSLIEANFHMDNGNSFLYELAKASVGAITKNLIIAGKLNVDIQNEGNKDTVLHLLMQMDDPPSREAYDALHGERNNAILAVLVSEKSLFIKNSFGQTPVDMCIASRRNSLDVVVSLYKNKTLKDIGPIYDLLVSYYIEMKRYTIIDSLDYDFSLISTQHSNGLKTLLACSSRSDFDCFSLIKNKKLPYETVVEANGGEQFKLQLFHNAVMANNVYLIQNYLNPETPITIDWDNDKNRALHAQIILKLVGSEFFENIFHVYGRCRIPDCNILILKRIISSCNTELLIKAYSAKSIPTIADIEESLELLSEILVISISKCTAINPTFYYSVKDIFNATFARRSQYLGYEAAWEAYFKNNYSIRDFLTNENLSFYPIEKKEEEAFPGYALLTKIIELKEPSLTSFVLRDAAPFIHISPAYSRAVLALSLKNGMGFNEDYGQASCAELDNKVDCLSDSLEIMLQEEHMTNNILALTVPYQLSKNSAKTQSVLRAFLTHCRPSISSCLSILDLLLERGASFQSMEDAQDSISAFFLSNKPYFTEAAKFLTYFYKRGLAQCADKCNSLIEHLYLEHNISVFNDLLSPSEAAVPSSNFYFSPSLVDSSVHSTRMISYAIKHPLITEHVIKTFKMLNIVVKSPNIPYPGFELLNMVLDDPANTERDFTFVLSVASNFDFKKNQQEICKLLRRMTRHFNQRFIDIFVFNTVIKDQINIADYWTEDCMVNRTIDGVVHSEPLLYSVAGINPVAAMHLIHYTLNPNFIHPHHQTTVLMHTLQFKHPMILMELVKLVNDVNMTNPRTGDSLLMEVARYDLLLLMRNLLNRGANCMHQNLLHYNVLLIAAAAGSIDVINELLILPCKKDGKEYYLNMNAMHSELQFNFLMKLATRGSLTNDILSRTLKDPKGKLLLPNEPLPSDYYSIQSTTRYIPNVLAVDANGFNLFHLLLQNELHNVATHLLQILPEIYGANANLIRASLIGNNKKTGSTSLNSLLDGLCNNHKIYKKEIMPFISRHSINHITKDNYIMYAASFTNYEYSLMEILLKDAIDNPVFMAIRKQLLNDELSLLSVLEEMRPPLHETLRAMEPEKIKDLLAHVNNPIIENYEALLKLEIRDYNGNINLNTLAVYQYIYNTHENLMKPLEKYIKSYNDYLLHSRSSLYYINPSTGENIVMVCLQKNNRNCIDILLQNPKIPNEIMLYTNLLTGYSVLDYFIVFATTYHSRFTQYRKKYIPSIKDLLKPSKNHYGHSVLVNAISSGNKDVFEFILDAAVIHEPSLVTEKSSVSKTTPLLIVASQCNFPTFETMFSMFNFQKADLEAVNDKSGYNVIGYLLMCDMQKYNTQLTEAFNCFKNSIGSHWIKNGMVNEYHNMKTGDDIAMIALKTGRFELFVKNFATLLNVSFKNSINRITGESLLMVAIRMKDNFAVEYLIETQKVDINYCAPVTKDYAYYYATEYENFFALRLLVKHKAVRDVQRYSKDGKALPTLLDSLLMRTEKFFYYVYAKNNYYDPEHEASMGRNTQGIVVYTSLLENEVEHMKAEEERKQNELLSHRDPKILRSFYSAEGVIIQKIEHPDDELPDFFPGLVTVENNRNTT